MLLTMQPLYIGTAGQVQCWEMPCSGDPNIKSLVDSSNIGKPGVWLFRIDQSAIQSCPNKGDFHTKCISKAHGASELSILSYLCSES